MSQQQQQQQQQQRVHALGITSQQTDLALLLLCCDTFKQLQVKCYLPYTMLPDLCLKLLIAHGEKARTRQCY